MHHKKFFTVSFILMSAILSAQKANIAIAIVNNNDKPIPLANVTNTVSKKTVVADSLGILSLEIDAKTEFRVSSVGYKDTIFSVDNLNKGNLTIKLVNSVNELNSVTVRSGLNTAQQNQMLQRQIAESELYFNKQNSGPLGNRTDFSGLINNPNSRAPVEWHSVQPQILSRYASNATITEIHQKEDTKGSPYFFNSWVKGIVADTADNIINDNSYWYNYNKISGSLVMTRDFINGLNVDTKSLVFFILLDSLQQQYTFVKVPSISPKLFCAAVAMGNKYDIFKLTTTKFEKSDYTTDGIVSHGNPYDEYADQTVYYVVDVVNNTTKPLSLRRKSIADAFNNDSDVNKYLSTYKGDINDEYLKNLVEATNKN